MRARRQRRGRVWRAGEVALPAASPTLCLPGPHPCLPHLLLHSPAPAIDREELSRTVRAVLLAGGESRNPLTRYRAMPAVPLGSSLMFIDVPINNCLKAGINKM